ncbi:flagellar motor protein [Reinekea blandensis]|uniref:Flagellar motor component n=1 Tax=Reinekea blandensis MED297 TaxID=314283 RepID=A4BEI4_9GAMM|nr:flagellar motor protein [Reinekea blandensis]EAR09411.1 Flagellar motor component [Reinekea sp. MED297] [Reinekea blandensis MED297]
MLALAGLLLAWFAVFGGHLLEGGQAGSLSNFPAALIVLGGTLAAGMIQAAPRTWRTAWTLFPAIFWRNHLDSEQTLLKLVRWCQLARRSGPLSLDPESGKEPDPFLRLGLQLIVDGADKDKLRHNLTIATEARENEWLKGADFFDSLGGYAPTMGIIGAVLGLIQVMTQIEDTQAIGLGIATAFVATIYGVGLANLFFLPVAGRLRSEAMTRSQQEEMALDGLLSILDGENPRMLERRLREYRL